FITPARSGSSCENLVESPTSRLSKRMTKKPSATCFSHHSSLKLMHWLRSPFTISSAGSEGFPKVSWYRATQGLRSEGITPSSELVSFCGCVSFTQAAGDGYRERVVQVARQQRILLEQVRDVPELEHEGLYRFSGDDRRVRRRTIEQRHLAEHFPRAEA